jgi:hypothetical protein
MAHIVLFQSMETVPRIRNTMAMRAMGTHLSSARRRRRRTSTHSLCLGIFVIPVMIRLEDMEMGRVIICNVMEVQHAVRPVYK